MRNLGVPVHSPLGMRMAAGKRDGCVATEMVDLVEQYSWGTVTAAPEGKWRVHSPPVDAVRRSNTGGPKNQEVNASHTMVARANWTIRRRFRVAAGLVV